MSLLFLSSEVCHLFDILRLLEIVRHCVDLVSWSVLADWGNWTWDRRGCVDFFCRWLLCWWLLHFIWNSSNIPVPLMQHCSHFIIFVAIHSFYIYRAHLFRSLRWLYVFFHVSHECHYMSLYCIISSSNSLFLNCCDLPTLDVIFFLSGRNCLNCF